MHTASFVLFVMATVHGLTRRNRHEVARQPASSPSPWVRVFVGLTALRVAEVARRARNANAVREPRSRYVRRKMLVSQ